MSHLALRIVFGLPVAILLPSSIARLRKSFRSVFAFSLLYESFCYASIWRDLDASPRLQVRACAAAEPWQDTERVPIGRTGDARAAVDNARRLLETSCMPLDTLRAS